jgi:hypothetical protein
LWSWLYVASALLIVRGASAQVVDFDTRTSVFYEPSSSSDLMVIHPGARLVVRPASWFALRAGYDADIVSGATEAIKRGPLSTVDVVSAATDFDDTRHVMSGGFSLTRDQTDLSATYSNGTESDYASQAISVAAGTSFLQNNTRVVLSYTHGFDTVCTTAYSEADEPSNRRALDSSEGCFSSSAEDRAERDVNLDNFQVAWTQNWTPVMNTQVVLTGALQNGFLENPYRSVEIAPAGDAALEHHPDNRSRMALALRVRYFVKPIKVAFGLGVRGYRDTWDILSHTYELSAERHILPWLRFMLRGRYYAQSGALFWSNDYTGGEPRNGPRGQYWSGDRELSPLASYSLGGRFEVEKNAARDERLGFFFKEIRGGVSLDAVKTELDDFTWGSEEPDDTLALLFTLTAGGSF